MDFTQKLEVSLSSDLLSKDQLISGTAENSDPSVSVITATLNSEQDLPRLLDSLRRQTDRDFECIVVDGGSLDRSWDIIQSHRDLVTQALGEPDHGLYDALNKAIRASKSEFYVVVVGVLVTEIKR